VITSRFPAFTFPNFRIFLAGQFISLIGSWMQSTVQPYLAYRLTSQPFYLGLVGFAQTLPALFFMLWGGVIIERLEKRKVVLVMQTILMLQAFMLAFFALTGLITIWHIIVLAFIQGLANSIEITARQSMMVELVDKTALPNAIALNSATFNLARVLGPTLSAPFLVFLQDNGEGWAFFANGVSFLFVIASLLLIKTKSQVRNDVEKLSIIEDFKDGQRYIFSTPIVAMLIVLVTVPGLFGFPFTQQIPVFARDVLHEVNDTAAAVATRNSLMVTAQGVGALIAALTLAMFSTMRRKGPLLISGQIVFALGLIGLSFSRTQNLALPLMTVAGWGMVTQLALTNTLIQITVPDHLRGRVMSTYLWAMQGISPFGSLLIGSLAQSLGASQAVAIGGFTCLIAYSLAHLFKSDIRRA